MTTFFWVAEIANIVTTITAFAALLIVLWLGPRRWTNQSFALFLAAIIMWMGPSFGLRLLVNLPQIAAPWQLLMNMIGAGFAFVGVALFWFIESFYPLSRRWRWAINLMGLTVYGLFMVLLLQNKIVNNPRRGLDGGLDFDITPIGSLLSGFHYVYDIIAVIILVRNRVWRERWHLVVGTIIVIFTTVMALISPAVAIQTYTIAVGTLFMAYELVNQQLFNPLLTMNQRLEGEVQARTAELKQTLATQERVNSELAIAREIQRSLLPRVLPAVPQLALAGRSLPALEVGGDFYTCFLGDNGRLSLAVGDVSGKGVPAALLMALSLRTFEMLVEHYTDQGVLLNAFHTALARHESGLNTAFLVVAIDPERHQAAIANAGLVPPLLWRAGRVTLVEAYGLPLGTRLTPRYQETVVDLQPGDRLLLVSDGIVEAMNGQREIWGFERLEECFSRLGHHAPEQIATLLLEEVNTFAYPLPQHDDMTLVVAELLSEIA